MSFHQGHIVLTLYGQSEQYKTQIDIADWEKVKDYRWMVKTNKHRRQKYAYAFAYEYYRDADNNHCQRTIYLHRVIMDAPKGLLVDHINHDTLDNRRSNLRLATIAQNSANSRTAPSPKNPFRGVHKRADKAKKPYHVKVGDEHVGYFACPIEAAKVYDAVASIRYGEFATLNFSAEVSE